MIDIKPQNGAIDRSKEEREKYGAVIYTGNE